jgi:hypothetical protein
VGVGCAARAMVRVPAAPSDSASRVWTPHVTHPRKRTPLQTALDPVDALSHFFAPCLRPSHQPHRAERSPAAETWHLPG